LREQAFLFSIVTVSTDVGMSLFLQVVVSKAASNLCFGFPSLSLVSFVHGRLSENFQNHRAAFGTTSEVTGSYTMESRNKLHEECNWKDFYN
jgi:hypothetical protein